MFTDITINFYHLCLLVAAVQGFILSLMLIFKNKVASRPNKYLALLLFSFSLHLSHQIGFISGFFNLFPNLHIFPFSYLFIVGPAVYFYVRSLTNPTFKPGWKSSLHFLPSIYLVPALLAYFSLLSGADKSTKMMFFTAVDFIETYVSVAVIFIYFAFSLKVISRYRMFQASSISTALSSNLNWLCRLLMTLSFGLLFWTGYFFYCKHIAQISLALEAYYPFYLSLAVLIYWIGFVGFLKTPADLNSFRVSIPNLVGLQLVPTAGAFETNLIEVENEAELKEKEDSAALQSKNEDKLLIFSKMGLDEDSAHMVLGKIRRKLETEKLYLKHQLNLNDFSKELGCSPRTISTVINQLCGENFSDFINSYRIQEVMKLLKDRSFRHYTLYGIATEAGFSSKTTFNRVFKEFTGYTPKQYRSVSWTLS
jgi:AraC-like DNA-binding protein